MSKLLDVQPLYETNGMIKGVYYHGQSYALVEQPVTNGIIQALGEVENITTGSYYYIIAVGDEGDVYVRGNDGEDAFVDHSELSVLFFAPARMDLSEDFPTIEVNGRAYRKVDRLAKEGDVVILTAPTKSAYIEQGVPYVVEPLHQVLNVGVNKRKLYNDRYNRTPKTVEVYEPIKVTSTLESLEKETAKWAQIGRKVNEYKVGDIIAYQFDNATLRYYSVIEVTDQHIYFTYNPLEEMRAKVEIHAPGLRLLAPVESVFTQFL